MKNTGQIDLTILLIVIAVIVSLVICFLGFDYVPAGNIGVKDTLGKIDDIPMQPGFAWTGLTTSTKSMTTRIQLKEYESSSASGDMQVVKTNIALNFKINPLSAPEIYKTIGKNYQDIIISPIVQEAVKSSTAKYTAENLVKARPMVKKDISDYIINRLEDKGLIVTEVSITDFEFSPEFDAAIERKQVAEQDALTAKNNLDAMSYTSQAMTLQKDVLEIKKIDIEQQRVENEKLWIVKWDGRMPTFLLTSSSTTGEETVPNMILDMSSLTN